jgi:CBS domain-containing protein
MTSTIPTTVAELMTRKIVTVSEADVLKTADYGMHRMHFRHLPVVDAHGKLVGLLSHGDLLHAESSTLSDREAERNALIWRQPVGRIMVRDVLTVRPEDSLTQAGRVLLECRIGCLPVVDSDGTLIGIVTKFDFIRLALQLLGTDVPRSDIYGLAKAV